MRYRHCSPSFLFTPIVQAGFKKAASGASFAVPLSVSPAMAVQTSRNPVSVLQRLKNLCCFPAPPLSAFIVYFFCRVYRRKNRGFCTFDYDQSRNINRFFEWWIWYGLWLHCLDAVWTIVEENTFTGKQAIIANCKEVSSYFASLATQFETVNVITANDKVVVTGTAAFFRNKKLLAFVSACDAYEFTGNGQILKITSYCIPKKADNQK